MGILDYPAMPSITAALASKVGKGSLVFNVKDYGAKGDGVTDDRDAILLALADANVAGGTLYFPPGTYFIATWSIFGTTGATTFNRYAFIVKSNVNIVGAGGAILSENIWYDNRRVMFYLDGSNITFDGLTFRNDYDMAGGNRPTSISIGAGDSFDATSTTVVKDIRIRNCNFIRQWYPTKFAFHEASGTATAKNITISNCINRAEPTSTSSGGFNFRSEPAGRITNVTVVDSECYDVTVSAAFGFYGTWHFVCSDNVNDGSQIDGAGFQCENGAKHGVVANNDLRNNYNGLWVDDSSFITASNNQVVCDTPNANMKGIRVTKQGYTEDPNKLVTGIKFTNNTLVNCYAVVENFSTPLGTPTFGFVDMVDNDIHLDGTTFTYGIRIPGCIANKVMGNRIVGAATYGIHVTGQANQYFTCVNNDAFKAGTESSTAIFLANSNMFRPIVNNNRWTTSTGVSASQPFAHTIKNSYVYSGTGTPEGAVSAPVGSTYHREDGAAATSFYVKESGTGATGWIAK